MSILILQIIIKQWDKSERSKQHIEQRAAIPDHYPIHFPPAIYALNEQCVIDQHGDDLLGDRISISQDENGKIKFDRFQLCLNRKVVEYIGQPDSDLDPSVIGSFDNQWVQCQYDWRYGVYEGGFHYWLYEEVSLNLISIETLNDNIFLHSTPSIIFTE